MWGWICFGYVSRKSKQICRKKNSFHSNSLLVNHLYKSAGAIHWNLSGHSLLNIYLGEPEIITRFPYSIPIYLSALCLKVSKKILHIFLWAWISTVHCLRIFIIYIFIYLHTNYIQKCNFSHRDTQKHIYKENYVYLYIYIWKIYI